MWNFNFYTKGPGGEPGTPGKFKCWDNRIDILKLLIIKGQPGPSGEQGKGI